jgi:hypothetical protein
MGLRRGGAPMRRLQGERNGAQYNSGHRTDERVEGGLVVLHQLGCIRAEIEACPTVESVYPARAAARSMERHQADLVVAFVTLGILSSCAKKSCASQGARVFWTQRPNA